MGCHIMKTKSFAKINLSLDVLNKEKPDGYHDLDMINLPINLFDVVILKINHKNDDIIIKTNKDNIPTDSRNVIYKVIEKFKKLNNLSFGINVKLIKNIPTEAGLGGGSSNAAATLNMLDKYFKTNMTLNQKIEFLAPITADGPFFVNTIPSRVRGIGDKIEFIDSKFNNKILLIKPKTGCSTKDVYSNLDYKNLEHPNNNKICEALSNNDINSLKNHCKNSLLNSAISLNDDIKDTLYRLSASEFDIVSMSGSGSTCFAISNKKRPFKTLKKIINKKNYDLIKICKIKI